MKAILLILLCWQENSYYCFETDSYRVYLELLKKNKCVEKTSISYELKGVQYCIFINQSCQDSVAIVF